MDADVVIIIHNIPRKDKSVYEPISFDIVVRKQHIEAFRKEFMRDGKFYEVGCKVVDRFLAHNDEYEYLGSEDLMHIWEGNAYVIGKLVELVEYSVKQGLKVKTVSTPVSNHDW